MPETIPNWPELFERCPDLIPEALRTPGELGFNAVRCEGPHHVGIPWAKSMLVKEPGFTIRHQNDIDMAQSQLADAKLVLDRAYTALCRDAAARWLSQQADGFGVEIFAPGDGSTKWAINIGAPEGEGETLDAALFAVCKSVLDARDAATGAAHA